MLRTGDMVGPLQMPDGRTSASITAATSLPGQTNKKEENWPFQVPDGYVRFSGDFRTDRHSGDVAECGWANGNPADGTVHAYVKASQTNGYAHASASNVYAIKPEAAAKMYKFSLNRNQ
ncbi:hypothetical protein GNQ08_07640 [Paenibacillus macerans]|uniref:Uncharacterized protein n=3 Tax=Paenibacillus macerans TaxID=44252 RepID=A0A6N8EVI3_PAEMA|nr:hypothetical protein [Paenibacillus macerans]MCY7556960.1 hypothetical protein [Paenibacillus macerans]MEC0154305.1 hypothetical protein [Paenibacillus macerans]MUG22288.1 hypothetical protein [Paenibacillus macerans]GBK65873.1 hypothetical protein PbDSM24746_58770 [Paenibacillus macerans]GBK72203.1 hypothetical protein PbJCM17693_59110 [Paenibacillus macerans]